MRDSREVSVWARDLRYDPGHTVSLLHLVQEVIATNTQAGVMGYAKFQSEIGMEILTITAALQVTYC